MKVCCGCISCTLVTDIIVITTVCRHLSFCGTSLCVSLLLTEIRKRKKHIIFPVSRSSPQWEWLAFVCVRACYVEATQTLRDLAYLVVDRFVVCTWHYAHSARILECHRLLLITLLFAFLKTLSITYWYCLHCCRSFLCLHLSLHVFSDNDYHRLMTHISAIFQQMTDLKNLLITSIITLCESIDERPNIKHFRLSSFVVNHFLITFLKTLSILNLCCGLMRATYVKPIMNTLCESIDERPSIKYMRMSSLVVNHFIIYIWHILSDNDNNRFMTHPVWYFNEWQLRDSVDNISNILNTLMRPTQMDITTGTFCEVVDERQNIKYLRLPSLVDHRPSWKSIVQFLLQDTHK